MRTFGKYVAVQELQRGGIESLWSARPADAPADAKPDYVVKTLGPANYLIGPDVLQVKVQAMLEEAACQKKASDAGARYWAAVHDAGAADGVAYCVLPLFPRSVEKLISGLVRPSGRVVHNVVASVLNGLEELKSSCGRSHGNLKPTNVLIGPGDDLETARVALTDPAVAPVAAQGGEAADVYALGELVYQLVTQRPFRTQVWPVTAAPEWSRLGRAGRRWREFCNRLLDPDPSSRVNTLAGARRELQRVDRGSGTVRLVAAVVVAAAVALAAVYGVRLNSAKRQAAGLETAYNGWFAGVQTAFKAADPPPLDLIPTDAWLRVRDLNPEDIAEFRRNTPVFGARARELDDDVKAIDSIRQSIDKSPVRKQLADHQAMYERLGWAKPAEFLRRRHEATAPADNNTAVGKELARFLTEWRGGLATLLSEIDALWGQLSQVNFGDQAVSEKWSQYFADKAKASASAVNPAAGTDTLAGFRTQLKALLDQDGRPFAEALNRLPAEGRQAYARDLRQNGTGFNWRNLQDYQRIKLDTDPLEQQKKSLEQALQQLKDQGTQKQEIEAEAKRLREAITAFSGRVWINKQHDEFQKQQSDLSLQLSSLQEKVNNSMVNPADWLAQMRARLTGDSPVSMAWQAWLQGQVGSDPGALVRSGRFGAVRDSANVYLRNLEQLDKTLFPAAQVEGDFKSAADAKRNTYLQRALVVLNRPGGSPIEKNESVAGWAREYARWVEELRKIAPAYTDADDLLKKGYGAGEAGPHGNNLGELRRALGGSAILEDVRPVVGPVLARIDNLVEVEQLEKATDLLDKAGDDAAPEVVLAVWRRLGAAGAWPAEPGDLKAEAGLRQRVEKIVAQIPVDEQRRKRLSEDLAEQGRQRWARFVNHVPALKSREDIDRALHEARVSVAAMGLDETQAARLDLRPEARYDLLLQSLRQSVTDPDVKAADLNSLIASFRRSVGALSREVTARKEVEATLAALAAFGTESSPGPRTPWTRAPGATGLTFRLPSGQTLEFVPGDADQTFYLGTTEVPVGLFIAWTNEQRERAAWLADVRSVGLGVRDGPKIWDVQGGAISLSRIFWLDPLSRGSYIYPPKLTRDDENLNDNALSAKYGGQPNNPKHPMQFVPADAARAFAASLGCRLPTPEEWKLAYAREGQQARSRANLRDALWSDQWAHVNGHRDVPWPDAGIFWPVTMPPSKRNEGQQARAAVNGEDGFLWFAPVDVTLGGTVFRHLVGNVAEFTHDPVANKTYVIGGSALSPPEVPPDQEFEVANLKQGYSDVGFRLAMTGDRPARRLDRLLQRENYVVYTSDRAQATTRPSRGG